MILHETTVHGRCPLNDQWDYYDVDLSLTDCFLDIAKFEGILDQVRGVKCVQEEIAFRIAVLLRESNVRIGRLVVTGRHSQNTKTSVIVQLEDESCPHCEEGELRYDTSTGETDCVACGWSNGKGSE